MMLSSSGIIHRFVERKKNIPPQFQYCERLNECTRTCFYYLSTVKLKSRVERYHAMNINKIHSKCMIFLSSVTLLCLFLLLLLFIYRKLYKPYITSFTTNFLFKHLEQYSKEEKRLHI